MPTFHPFMDNYALRRYKELRSLKLKAGDKPVREKRHAVAAVPISRSCDFRPSACNGLFSIVSILAIFSCQEMRSFCAIVFMDFVLCYDQ